MKIFYSVIHFVAIYMVNFITFGYIAFIFTCIKIFCIRHRMNFSIIIFHYGNSSWFFICIYINTNNTFFFIIITNFYFHN